MASKTIYKKIALEAAQIRNMRALTNDKKTKVNTIVTNFFQYLKNVHS